MRKARRLTLGAVVLAAALAALSSGQGLRAEDVPPYMEGGQWVATPDFFQCAQNTFATECAEWETLGGTPMLTCCVPPQALGTSDFSACTNTDLSRGRTEL